MTATDLPKCLRKYARLIAEVSDERGSDDGYWVYLASGWLDHEGETHCIHEDTPGECAGLMKCVRPCTRSNCCNSG